MDMKFLFTWLWIFLLFINISLFRFHTLMDTIMHKIFITYSFLKICFVWYEWNSNSFGGWFCVFVTLPPERQKRNKRNLPDFHYFALGKDMTTWNIWHKKQRARTQNISTYGRKYVKDVIFVPSPAKISLFQQCFHVFIQSEIALFWHTCYVKPRQTKGADTKYFYLQTQKLQSCNFFHFAC